MGPGLGAGCGQGTPQLAGLGNRPDQFPGALARALLLTWPRRGLLATSSLIFGSGTACKG